MPEFPSGYFERYDQASDAEFYRTPRLVTHIDDAAIGAVTQLYRELFPAGGTILDLMSSWVSHLPPEVEYGRVVGLGMNQVELDANPRLHGICVSIQYLTQPVAVIREVGRVLRPGAPLVVTFSNRCFPTKAVAIWQALDDAEHLHLVERYMAEACNLTDIKRLDRSPRGRRHDPLYAVVGRRAGALTSKGPSV
jgi:hypothetical protein